jgi:hypothetical protein
MADKSFKEIALAYLLIAFLILLPFIPGPSFLYIPAQVIFSLSQLAGIFGLILVPFGLVQTIKQVRKKQNVGTYKIRKKPIILLTLPLLIFTSSTFLAGKILVLSRNIAIERATPIINAIEKYKKAEAVYPENLEKLKPEFIQEIPTDLIIGIRGYNYERAGNTYTLGFSQNVIMYFNFEIVNYNPLDEHATTGELNFLEETGHKHWKIYFFD